MCKQSGVSYSVCSYLQLFPLRRRHRLPIVDAHRDEADDLRSVEPGRAGADMCVRTALRERAGHYDRK